MKTFITSMAVALLFAVSANADVIHSTDYEADGLAQGTGLGIAPASMEFTDGGGDFAGPSGLGLSDTTANSGLYSYVVDTSATVDNGNGWGGTWSGINSNSALNSGGFFPDAASAIAAGPGSQYIDFSEGATFTASVWAATDAAGVTGGRTFAPRLEFFNGAGTEVFRADGGTFGTLPQQSVSVLTTEFQQFTQEYTLTAGDAAAGIVRVAGVIGADGLGFSTTDGGNIYFDDFSYEVSAANVITVPPAVVPEPSSACLLLAGLMGLCGVRRRKS